MKGEIDLRKPLIAGNWKMNHTPTQALEMVRELLELGEFPSDVEGLLIPAFPALCPLVKELKETSIKLGAQNMSSEDQGAFTGEVSWDMLLDLQVDYVVLGHSERRKYFFESDEVIAKKVNKALEHKITPILCVGESLEERKAGDAKTRVKSQLQEALKEVTPDKMKEVVIAYEPIWAIGTGVSASAKDAQEMCQEIRNWVVDNFNQEVSEVVRILYGGSVKPSTIAELLEEVDVDGALVGGASLSAKDIYELLSQGSQND